jgi:hypothetical protein
LVGMFSAAQRSAIASQATFDFTLIFNDGGYDGGALGWRAIAQCLLGKLQFSLGAHNCF